MGWWASEDGAGQIGDRPADILGTALTEALGERFDPDLLAGFLAGLGAALLRNPAALVAEGPAVAGQRIEMQVEGQAPVEVPIRPAVAWSGLERSLFDALEAAAFQYQLSGVARPPRLAELLETVGFVARGHLYDPETGAVLVLRGIRPARRRQRQGPARVAADLRWASMRALLQAPRPDAELAEMLAAGLEDADWRVRMVALLAVGRHRLAALADRAARVAVPPETAGLREVDRRALLALRDCAAAVAAGGEPDPPAHPDAAVQARRMALRDAVLAAIHGEAWPAPGDAAQVLRALADPHGAAAEAALPEPWARWLPAAPEPPL
ncbi:hypothetical protein [Siccirubricoccus sp. G192]|uniref:hypothetical protein n=1 Tax=Siccirubricoccus sp. G192 TaxID=2849651 RepID=UPI001C2B8CF9|nr:hypothetical protein [Siccirubricoccus sp. G192]MBV1796820.1 hypothetical protein [Siccirubricoccus sp. G192]